MNILQKICAKSGKLLIDYASKGQKNIPGNNESILSHAINNFASEQVNNARRLHLGCGATIFDNWLNADLVQTDSVPLDTWEKLKDIFIMDATQTFPFEDEQFEYVYCEDFIEHFDQKDGMSISAECYRILKPGGVWRVSTPSFTKILIDNWVSACLQ